MYVAMVAPQSSLKLICFLISVSQLGEFLESVVSVGLSLEIVLGPGYMLLTRRRTHCSSKINNLEQLNTHGSLGMEQMARLQLSGPPEAEKRYGKAAENLVVMDNKKEAAWAGKT